MLTLAGLAMPLLKSLAVAALCSAFAEEVVSPEDLVDESLFIVVVEAPAEYVRVPDTTADASGRGLLEFRPLRALKGGIPTYENLRFLGELVDDDDFNEGEVPYRHIRPSGQGPCIAYTYRPGERYLFFLNDVDGRLSPHWVALAPTNEQLRHDFGRDPWFRWVRARLRRAERRSNRPRQPARRRLAEAIREVRPEATEWTVDRHAGRVGVDERLLVSFPAREESGRISTYDTAVCEYTDEANDWSCRIPEEPRLEIQAPRGATTCPSSVRGVLNPGGLSNAAVLQVVDAVRHGPDLKTQLVAACGRTMNPPTVPFRTFRCSVSVVTERDGGAPSVMLPMGAGCSAVIEFREACADDGACELTPTRCSSVCS